MILLAQRFDDSRLKHFIPNASPILRDSQSRYQLFGGDLQPHFIDGATGRPVILPNEEVLEALTSFMTEAFEIAGVP